MPLDMTAQDSDFKAFKTRLHAQIRTDVEPAVRQAKQDLLEKMKKAHDKDTRERYLKDYNDTILALDQEAMDRFKTEVVKERMRRAIGDTGDVPADRAQSRIGGFVGEYATQSEWNLEGMAQERPTPTLGHNRARSSLGNNSSFLASAMRPGSSTAMYTNGRPTPPPLAKPSHEELLQSTAKDANIDEARIRKFAEEQARLLRAHSPVTPITDSTTRKFQEEQARLQRTRSPEIPRNDAHLKFAEEQARLRRAHSPELARNGQGSSPSQSKFAEEQARLNRAHSPDTTRNDVRSKAAPSPAASADSARLAAFAEQQLRAREEQLEQAEAARKQAEAARNRSGSRLGQNGTAPARGKTPSGTPPVHIPTAKVGRHPIGSPAAQSMFGRFPLNEKDDIKPLYDEDSNLTKVEILFFDLDGTVLDWRGSVAEELRRLGKKYFPNLNGVDWQGFATKWREQYLATIRNLAENGDSLPPQTVYRTTLDQLLNSDDSEYASRWTSTVRNQLTEVWERVHGYPDTKDGLQAMKTLKTVATLSNLPLRTQTQMSRHAGLTWDVCLSGSLLGAFKPSPAAYKEAARSMSLAPSTCAVVSAHLEELRGAAAAGLKTIYVRRSSEDQGVEAEVLSKLEGGDFDLVVDSFEHLAIVLGCDD
ncbi:HAD-like domain-containing protein [Roridomyces roridus]|uniref:HAD-like domain-containing protein n=1 Tax=Roridomyces roridus TaxID=1738132 RepID=A0AAD7F9J4_9AGAR|nr:HAD-like domain-containing protein [Roridomyces roridus]